MEIPVNRRSTRSARTRENSYSSSQRGQNSNENSLTYIQEISRSYQEVRIAVSEIRDAYRNIISGFIQLWINSCRFVQHIMWLVVFWGVPLSIAVTVIIFIVLLIVR